MSYEPEYGDFYDYEDLEDDYMDPEDICGFGSYGMPALGTEDCEFMCPAREGCRAIFFAQKDCVNPVMKTDELAIMRCPFFHMGNCYISFSNYEPSRFQRIWMRLQCRLGKIPENPDRRVSEREEEIEVNHGKLDVSCEHGSRWIWWKDEMFCPEGAWNQVVQCSSCNCDTPPRPFKVSEQ